jgi:hypothetical protein
LHDYDWFSTLNSRILVQCLEGPGSGRGSNGAVG